MDIYGLAYEISFDEGNAEAKATLPAYRVAQWIKIPDPVAGTYLHRMYPNIRLVGDNADGYGSPSWNPANFKSYEKPLRPEDETLVVDYDEKKNWHLDPKRVQTPFTSQRPSDQQTAKTAFSPRAKNKKDAAEADLNA